MVITSVHPSVLTNGPLLGTLDFSKFLYQTVFVFPQMKDTKHIRQDFYSVAWVMP